MATRGELVTEWLDRFWTLVWGSIVLATLLLVAKQIDAAQWTLVWTGAFGGYASARVIEAAGNAFAAARRAPNPRTKEPKP